jgi:hypothetical protein
MPCLAMQRHPGISSEHGCHREYRWEVDGKDQLCRHSRLCSAAQAFRLAVVMTVASRIGGRVYGDAGTSCVPSLLPALLLGPHPIFPSASPSQDISSLDNNNRLQETLYRPSLALVPVEFTYFGSSWLCRMVTAFIRTKSSELHHTHRLLVPPLPFLLGILSLLGSRTISPNVFTFLHVEVRSESEYQTQ